MFLPSTYFVITSVRNGCDRQGGIVRAAKHQAGRWTRAGQRLLCCLHDNWQEPFSHRVCRRFPGVRGTQQLLVLLCLGLWVMFCAPPAGTSP